MDIQEAISQLKQVRHELYEASDHRADALMELLDGQSSTPHARSVAELSLSPFFHRGYGSAYDTIAHLFQASDRKIAAEERRTWEQRLLRLKVRYREIGTPAQSPKPRGNSPGPAKGTRLARRERQRVIKKGRKTRKKVPNST